MDSVRSLTWGKREGKERQKEREKGRENKFVIVNILLQLLFNKVHLKLRVMHLVAPSQKQTN